MNPLKTLNGGSLLRRVLLRARCQRRKCVTEAIASGLCRYHYLKALAQWERASLKTKIRARAQPNI